MQKTLIKLVVLGVSLSTASGVFAQDGFGFSKKLGDSDFYPAVRVDYRTDSNVFLNSETGAETEASGVRVIPEFLLVADTGQVSLKAEYRGEYNTSDVSVASYADHALRFETNAEFSSRFSAGARLAFAFDHQNIGTLLTRNIADENTDAVEFNQTDFSVFGNYGANQARGNIRFGLDLSVLEFTNQAGLTEGESFSSVEPYAVFSLRLSPDLRALAEVRLGATDFDNDLKDRTDTTVLLGVDIAATGKLNGQIKIGSTLTSYDNLSLNDTTELAVRTRLSYAPVDYSVFSLAINRDTDKLSDSAATSNAASVTDLLGLNWTHSWSSRLFHRAGLSRTKTSQDCPTNDIIVIAASYELNLRFRRWLEFGVGGRTTNREVKSCAGDEASANDSSRSSFGVHLRATL